MQYNQLRAKRCVYFDRHLKYYLDEGKVIHPRRGSRHEGAPQTNCVQAAPITSSWYTCHLTRRHTPFGLRISVPQLQGLDAFPHLGPETVSEVMRFVPFEIGPNLH
jgi:hypothetical protein